MESWNGKDHWASESNVAGEVSWPKSLSCQTGCNRHSGRHPINMTQTKQQAGSRQSVKVVQVTNSWPWWTNGRRQVLKETGWSTRSEEEDLIPCMFSAACLIVAFADSKLLTQYDVVFVHVYPPITCHKRCIIKVKESSWRTSCVIMIDLPIPRI